MVKAHYWLMPSASLTCPHCEKSVEIQVTAVTRSRPCPECGRTIMLQVAGRQSRIKHKALLMSAMPPTDTLGKPEFDTQPNQLPGDAFERMCSDPEITRARRHFFGAVGAVLGLVLLATIVHLSGFWRIQPQVGDRVATAPKTPQVGVAAKKETLSESVSVMEKTNSVKKLSFRLSGAAAESDVAAKEAQQILEKFLAAGTVAEKLACVANPGALEERMKVYYQQHPPTAMVYERIESSGLPHEDYVEFRIHLKGASAKFAAMVVTPDGPKLDWPSFALVGDLEWGQMREKRPQIPVLMRVLARPATFFSGHFKQSDGLRCVQLVPASDPSAAPVFGYVPQGSDLDKTLNYWLKSSGGELSALTLKICYSPESRTADQAWITDLVTAGWVTLGEGVGLGSE